MQSGSVEQGVVHAHEAARRALPFDDVQDFEDARRGFVGTIDPMRIEAADGRVVWDMDAYRFVDGGDAPPTVHPSLWRQAQLLAIHGLFEVAPGIYQVRGFDLSNLHLIEGDEGVIVADPLISTETAAAALALYRRHRGNRPVTGLLYSHSHADHFGGSRGVLSDAEVAAGVPVIAPSGFLEHAVSENVYAGTAMSRRAAYMYGALLEPHDAGQVTAGLGPSTSTGTVTLIPPTLHVERTGQEEIVDGVRFVFQLTPGTEAPAEMNFYLPEQRAFFCAENASHTLHNVLTLRGALVRDPRIWAHYLDEAIEVFGRDSDVLFACHHWPCWGTERIVEFLAGQRDLYAYIHDQTLRLMNQGYTGTEIAELVTLPPSLERAWHCRGYYGSVSHNVKAVYQRYMGWFDGNPAHLWQHPPVEAAKRYVAFMGGSEAVLEKARSAFDAGDFRWVAQVVDHVVFAEPGNTAARELQAATLEQLGYGAENATWRNFFLNGAKELREGPSGTPAQAAAPDVVGQLSLEQLFDALAIRIDGPRAGDEHLALDWALDGERYATTLQHGVLTHRAGGHRDGAQATITGERMALAKLAAGMATAAELVAAGALAIDGDAATLETLLGLVDATDPNFAIVTP